MKNISLSFVIPVYNEEKRLYKTIKALQEFNIPMGLKLSEIIFVNDGSVDNTKKIVSDSVSIIEEKTKSKVILVNLVKNRGKGYAVKVGMLKATSDYTLFFDADMATPLDEINKFIPYFIDGSDVVIGTRKNGESTVVIHQPKYREILGKCFTYITNIVLNTWVTDFTCGFKAFNKSAKNKVFKYSKIERWGYDAEIMFIAKNLGYDVKEVAVLWSDDKDTKVKLLNSIVSTLRELFSIRYNQILGRYNFKSISNRKGLLVVGSYPERSYIHGSKTVGGASYTKNTLISLKKLNPNYNIVQLAEKFGKKEVYMEQGIEVKRIWTRNSILSVFVLIINIFRAPQKSLLIEFEMFMLGGFIPTLLFVFMIPMFRVSRKVTIVVHQVVGSVDSFESSWVKKIFFKMGIPLFYLYLKYSATNLVVFEEELRRRLGSVDKVKVIPHAVEKISSISKQSALEKLNFDSQYNHFLYFGFISPYKGVLELVRKWKKNDKDRLIIAGGLNPNYKNSKFHINYLDQVKREAKKKGIICTGFVEEKDIKNYFCACDWVILPYQTFMSSSGPLSLVFSYSKAFIMSTALNSYFKSEDMRTELVNLALDEDDFVFNFHGVDELVPDSYISKKNKIETFSKNLSQKRNWDSIGQQYTQLLK